MQKRPETGSFLQRAKWEDPQNLLWKRYCLLYLVQFKLILYNEDIFSGDNNMANIHKEIEELQNSSKKIKNIPEERLLPLLAYKYIYLTSPEDIRVSDFKRITVDGPNDGGIDAIFAHPEEPRLVIIQSKYYSKPISNKDIVIDAFRKLAKTINDLKNHQTASYREDLRKV